MTGKKVTKILIVFGIVVLISIGVAGLEIYRSGFWHGPDAKFGDQHLKTSVALIEMHKVRFGNYPRSMRELKFVGDWDGIALSAVRYAPSVDLDKYCVEVVRGWIGKPDLNMPDDFWHGTGYDPALCQ
jgi:hypothetical protein